jgi:hypothetical protein
VAAAVSVGTALLSLTFSIVLLSFLSWISEQASNKTNCFNK